MEDPTGWNIRNMKNLYIGEDEFVATIEHLIDVIRNQQKCDLVTTRAQLHLN